MPKTKPNSFRLIAATAAAAILLSATGAPAQTSSLTILPAGEIQRLKGERAVRIGVAGQALERDRIRLGATTEDTFEAASSAFDDLGRLHVRYERRYKGLRVIGGGVKVTVDPSGASARLGRVREQPIQLRSIAPAVQPDQVRETIARDLKVAVDDLTTELETVVLTGGDARGARLAWMAEAKASAVEPARYYIDAGTGAILEKLAVFQHAFNPANGTGHSRWSGDVTVPASWDTVRNHWVLLDPTRGNTRVYDLRDQQPSDEFQGELYTDAADNEWGNGGDWQPGDNTFGALGQTDAVDVFHTAVNTWDTLANVFNRDSLNDAGMAIKLRVHARKAGDPPDQPYGDAYWDKEYANFGDSNYSTGPRTTAHEIGHGFWQYAVAADYKKEAGGLNEGNSDIFAAIVRHYVVLAHAQGPIVPTNNPGDLSLFVGRSINPWAYDNEGQIGLPYYYDYVNEYNNMGTQEFHLQGCVYGRLFATLAMGAPSVAEYEAGPPCPPEGGEPFACLVSPYVPQGMVGIGMHKASKIWYTATIGPEVDGDPTFHEMRTAWLQAAADLYGAGSPEYNAVMNAFHAVNIGDEAVDATPPNAFVSVLNVDNEERVAYIGAGGTDDLGIHHMEVSIGGDTKFVHGGYYLGYFDLGHKTPGNLTAGVTAWDSSGKSDDDASGFAYLGSNTLIQNGGFENGAASWDSGGSPTFEENPDGSFVGSGYVSFSGNSSIQQSVNVPPGITNLKLGFRVRVNEGNPLASMMLVEVLTETGSAVLEVVQTLSPSQSTGDKTTNYYQKFVANLDSFAGQPILIRFRSANASPDQYRLDQVYLIYTAPPSADFTVEVDEDEGSVIFQVANIQNVPDSQIDYIEIGSPAIPGIADHYWPYIIRRPTSEFTVNTQYEVQAKMYDHFDAVILDMGTQDFTVKPVNQLVVNGQFEGAAGFFWSKTGASGYCLYNPAAGESVQAFIGHGCAWFDGAGSIRQNITIPASAFSAKLTFRLKIDRLGDEDDLADDHLDKLRVVVQDRHGNSTLAVLDEIPGDTDTANEGVTHMSYRKFTYSLTAFKGQEIRLKFETQRGGAGPMMFYLDNVGATYKELGKTQ